ncbi:uncharacterized protein SEPMUDRAFT_132278 [Sphaerulina musiva SO2202]|uniref:Uncharacterized protein n=1 Tax=Sphaerulina musiva (strain SO2202) TaxID=692275 RepID=M3CLJ3_SPHMS|nr:uncharacterized protein SEPMUDRAFT_132278 [Sphaerulina musiva SO2202]EMF14663.1 hypothetical protein SEPMUDRAFT_132278 [Sphaerulina musiva SO2202]
MGIILSTTRYAPFSLVTGIIGLISFVFTLTTWLRVLWGNFTTAGQATHEVHAYLTNLRTELLEERASIRVMRKQCRKYQRRLEKRYDGGDTLMDIGLDDVSLKTMADTIKRLIKQFQELERPFLAEGSEGIGGYQRHERRSRRRRNESVSPYYEHSAYAAPPPPSPPNPRGSRARSRGDSRRRRRRKGQRDEGDDEDDDEDEDDDADTFWAQRTQYKQFGIVCRYNWVQKKSQCQELFSTLSRVQIRRIARQVGGLSLLAYESGPRLERSEAMLTRIEHRLGNIVGVRRVE